jgi:simple sugar transport system permease protein
MSAAATAVELSPVVGVLLGIAGGVIRGSVPFLFVSLGECLTEKSGKFNLGMEGVLLFGAMVGCVVAVESGSAWLGLLSGGAAGMVLVAIHAWIVQLPRVNDVAAGVALATFGAGLAFFFGKPYIASRPPLLPSIPLGAWSDNPVVQSALRTSPLFIAGIVLALVLRWYFSSTRSGLRLRSAGDHPQAARALGVSLPWTRTVAILAGGFLAGMGGAHLSLYFPGNWNDGVSSGQGWMAVALVIFARWQPVGCLWASILFGGMLAVGPSLQAAGVTGYYHLFNAVPYVLTVVIMVVTCSRHRRLAGMPGGLGKGE